MPNGPPDAPNRGRPRNERRKVKVTRICSGEALERSRRVLLRCAIVANGKDMRSLLPVALALTTMSAFAQTQPTRPSAYATFPTLQSAFPTAALSPCYPYSSFNPTSSCYTGTPYRSYSAIEPFAFPSQKNRSSPGSTTLDEDQAKSRIEARGYLDVSRLERDARGIWRGKATMKDGRSVEVILDLEGNIYSELSTLYIRIRPAPSNR